MGSRIRVAGLLLALVLVAAACDWSSVGFDATRGSYSAFDTKITPGNVTGLTQRWKADGGFQASAPVVIQGRIFVSTQPSGTTAGGLVAYNADGVGCSSASPATCTPLWSKSFPGDHSNPAISPPLLTDGYVSADGVDVQTFMPFPNIGAYDVNIQHVGGSFDPATGSPTLGETRDGAAPAATVAHAVYGYRSNRHEVIDTNRFKSHDVARYLVASVPADQGKSFDIWGTTYAPTDYVGSAPAVSDGTLFMMRPDQLQAYDAHGQVNCNTSLYVSGYSCSPIWTGTLSQSGAFDGMPAIAKGRVYVPELNGGVEVFDARGCGQPTCASQWTAHAGSVHIAPVAVTDTTLFVTSDDGHLYAFPSAGCGSATCEPTWTANIPSGPHAPSVAGSVLFVGTNNGTLAAFNTNGCGQNTCTPLWTTNVGAPISTAPVVSDGRVFVTDTAGTVHAYGF